MKKQTKMEYVSPIVAELGIFSNSDFLVDTFSTTEGDSGEDLELDEMEDF
ncbi:MAG: hypothetical protein IKH49_02970 [Bacteroidales bacterium]|nr:hypothetical protein [Bacteroidales bacterium]